MTHGSCILRTLICGVLLSGLSIGVLAADLVINEIAWAGTAAGSADEWIELYNASERTISLAGWTLAVGETVIRLAETGDATLEARTLHLAPGEYLLLERTDDNTVSDVSADILYKGSLSNTGADIRLLDPAGETVDRLSASDGWPGGASADGDIPYATLERLDPLSSDWSGASNNGVHRNGLDASGQPLNGTPGAENSTTFLARHQPRIDLLSPLPATASGMIVITWAASDPDGGDGLLRVDIELSTDEGETWTIIVDSLTNAGSYAWDTTRCDDSAVCQLRIRVRDADGYEALAESSVFAIDNAS